MPWWKKLFGRALVEPQAVQAPAGSVQAPTGDAASVISEDDPRIAEGHAAITAYWQTLGKVEPDVISYMINPMFTGGPRWPNIRQAYRIVRLSGSLILSSDGLADPFVGTNITDRSGMGLEVYIEIEGAQEYSLEDIMNSAEFGFLQSVAANMADHGGIADLLNEFGVLSMPVPVNAVPWEGWNANADEPVLGTLIGMEVEGRPSQVVLPFGSVQMVALTPLRPDELDRVAQSGAIRKEIAERIANTASAHRFNPERASVL